MKHIVMLEDASDEIDIEDVQSEEIDAGFAVMLGTLQATAAGGVNRRQRDRIEMLKRYFEGEDEDEQSET